MNTTKPARGGRKEMILPVDRTAPRQTDDTLVKALAREIRWKRMQESGEFVTLADLTEREGIAQSRLSRVPRMTLLAPDIVEAILDGRQEPKVTSARLISCFSMGWEEQRVQNQAPRASR